MSEVAAEFIEKVAAASMRDARKKLSDLVWGTGTMYSHGEACALGIAELALCSSLEDIDWCSGPTDMAATSRLGKRGARAIVSLKSCPIGGGCGGYGDFSAENIVSHINDSHAKSWAHCKRLLRRFARLERVASEKGS